MLAISFIPNLNHFAIDTLCSLIFIISHQTLELILVNQILFFISKLTALFFESILFHLIERIF